MFEFTETTLDEMAFLIERRVDWGLLCARRIVRNDGGCAEFGDHRAKVVGVVGGVREDEVGLEAVKQPPRLRRVAGLAGRQQEPHRQSQSADSQMDFCAQAAARAADRLILSPPFAPEAC